MSLPPPSTPGPQDQPEDEAHDSETPNASGAEETQLSAAPEPTGEEPATAEASSDSVPGDAPSDVVENEAAQAGDEAAAYQAPDWSQAQPLPPQKTSPMKVALVSLLAVALVFSGGVIGYFLFKPDETDSAVQAPDIETPTDSPDQSEEDADDGDDGGSGSGPTFDVSYPDLGGPWEEYDIEDPQTPCMIYSENWIIEVADGWVAVAHYGLLDRARVNYNASEPEQTIEYVADNFVSDAFWAQTSLETTDIEYTEVDIDGTETALLAEFRASWAQDGGIFEVPDSYEDIAILLGDINGRDAVISIVGIPESENDRYDDMIDLFDDISVN